VPLAGSETPTDDERRTEQIMLGIRLAEGMPSDWAAPGSLDALIADGLVTTTADRVVLTLHGRLLCDLVVRRLRWG
jgi:oxygen-independent coproporphyrinogen-3 oxidase